MTTTNEDRRIEEARAKFDKAAQWMREQGDRPMPCGHAIANLIGGGLDSAGLPDVTRCGQCQTDRKAAKEARGAGAAGPFAALQAAEEAVLVAGGWTKCAPTREGDWWTHPTKGREVHSCALAIERYQHDAKGRAR